MQPASIGRAKGPKRNGRENRKTEKTVVISIPNVYRTFAICQVQSQALTFIFSFSVFDNIIHWVPFPLLY